MKTITFLNQKGGCGKTSSVFHLSGVLAAMGLRVLLVDNDPQASLTQGFLGPAAMESLDPAVTVAAVYEGDPEPSGLVMPAGPAGVWLAPGSPFATEANMRPRDHWGDDQWALRAFTEALHNDFDLCLIDCPPNLHLCSWAALLAADAVVVPLQPEDFGSQGLKPVGASVDAARRANPGLHLAGYLLTMTDKRLAVHATYEAMLRERYGLLVFTNPVPRAKDFVEAVGARAPVNLYKPKSAATRAVKAVADELLARAGVALEGQGVAA